MANVLSAPTTDQRYDFPRPLWNPQGDNIIAYAEQVMELSSGKKQSDINSEVQTSLNGKATAADIVAAKNELLDLIYAAL